MLEYFSLPIKSSASSGLTKTPSAAIIFLHGLGDMGKSWAPFFESSYQKLSSNTSTSATDGVLYIFPNAPINPVTINGGMRMPSWYDIHSLNYDNNDSLSTSFEDRKGFDESSSLIMNLVEDLEKKGIPKNKIILGGFSQGGAVALYLTLKYNINWKGLIILSSYLPFSKSDFSLKPSSVATSTPIFFGHGKSDSLVSFQWGQESAKKLSSFQFPVTFKGYSYLDHGVSADEEKDVNDFILKLFENK